MLPLVIIVMVMMVVMVLMVLDDDFRLSFNMNLYINSKNHTHLFRISYPIFFVKI